MPVNIRVDAVFPGGFGPVKRESAAVDRELKQQIRERQRLLRLSAGLERDITREERAQVREVKEQIAQRRRLNQLSKSLDRDLAQDRSARLGSIKGAAGVAALAAGVTVTAAADLSKTAAAAKRLESATDALGRRFGVTGDQIVTSIQEASSYTIDRMAAMEAANKAMLLGVVDNEKQFGELAQIAIVLGRAMGQDATKSLDDLTTALGRQSNLILDNLGIIVDTQKAYEDYAKTLGKSASDLSDNEKQQAFTNAALEAGRRAMSELGEVTLDTSGKYERLNARFSDLKVSSGELVNAFLESSGGLDLMNEAMDRLIDTADGLTFVVEQTKLLNQAINESSKTGNETVDMLNNWAENAELATAAMNPLGYVLQTAAEKGAALLFNTEEVGEKYAELTAAAEKAAQGVQATTTATQDNTAATEENTDAQDDAAKAAEKLAATREKAVRAALDIEDKAHEDEAEARQKFFDDSLQAWNKYQADLLKRRQDLKKDLIKIDADTGKAVTKERQNTDRQIKAAEQQREKEQKFQRRREQIDAMADQRLFQYEIKQLGAEGDALAIQQARERRDIEQQAASERKDLDAEQEESQFSDSQQRLKDSAAERIAEIKRAASEEKEAKKADLEESEAAEAESLAKRIEDLRTFRDDKLAEIDESRLESLEALGRELAEAKDLTKTQLDELTPIIGQIGADAADAWADGFTAGIERNKQVQELLGLKDNDFTGRDFGKTSASGTPNTPGFAAGGRPPVGLDVIVGEDGPELFRADRPGTIIPASQTAAMIQGGGLTVNMPAITINSGGGGVSERQVMALLERYRAAMMSELSEMLE